MRTPVSRPAGGRPARSGGAGFWPSSTIVSGPPDIPSAQVGTDQTLLPVPSSSLVTYSPSRHAEYSARCPSLVGASSVNRPPLRTCRSQVGALPEALLVLKRARNTSVPVHGFTRRRRAGQQTPPGHHDVATGQGCDHRRRVAGAIRHVVPGGQSAHHRGPATVAGRRQAQQEHLAGRRFAPVGARRGIQVDPSPEETPDVDVARAVHRHRARVGVRQRRARLEQPHPFGRPGGADLPHVPAERGSCWCCPAAVRTRRTPPPRRA